MSLNSIKITSFDYLNYEMTNDKFIDSFTHFSIHDQSPSDKLNSKSSAKMSSLNFEIEHLDHLIRNFNENDE